MPDLRTNQTVAERLELQLGRFPNLLHRRRRWFTLVCGLLPLLLFTIFVARGDHTIFLSQPVAASHRHFQDDCQTCHRTPWQPLVRLASIDAAAQSVRDQDCHQCHDQRKDDHHALAMAKGVPDCAACHQEHRGAIRLTDQADASCVKCHEPFANHPQFSLLRHWPLDEQPSTNDMAELWPSSVATFEPDSGTWADKTKLKFSHQQHLAALVPGWKDGVDEVNSLQPTQLNCADCHEPDANGHYMQPIIYEQHCQECHPLRFSSKLDLAAGPNSSDRHHSLPHETPEIVHSVMRARLIDYARRHPDEVATPDTDTPSRLPNRQTRPPSPQQEWDWVEEELKVLADAVFRTPTTGDPLPTSPSGAAADTSPHPSNACLKCHHPGGVSVAEARQAVPGFAIAPPGIPTRWLTHSRFRHDRHLKMECVDCHQGTRGIVAVTTAASPAGALVGTTVKDILMPPIEKCQTCHGATGGAPEKIRARKHCTECHQYHHVHHAKAADGRTHN
jgi:hypothetical protein